MHLDFINKSYTFHNTPSMMTKSMFFYIQSCGYYISAPNYMLHRKEYKSILVLLTLEGIGILEYRGKTYRLFPNQLFIIDCMDFQRYYTGSSGKWVFDWVHFYGANSQDYFNSIYADIGPVLEIDENIMINTNLRNILNFASTKDSKFDIIASCRIVEILTELLLISRNHYFDRKVIPNYIQDAISMIQNNYMNQVSLAEIANSVNMDKYYLTKQFRKYTGYSLYEYAINYRITVSKSFLKATSLPIKDISEKIGFNNVSHFIKIFKQKENITPSNYRRYWGNN